MSEGVVHLLKIFEILFIASVKFFISPFEAERCGFDFKHSFLITTTGGAIGIILFSLIGEILTFGWKNSARFFKTPSQITTKRKKNFTWTRKFIVRTKMKFGLTGLIITTPSILSIPVGAFVIHRFYKNKWRNIFLLLLSLTMWSLLLNGAAQYIQISQYLPK